MPLFQPPGVKASCVEQRPTQLLQQPRVPVQPIALCFRRAHQAVEEPERCQDPMGQPVAVQGGVAGSQNTVHHDGAAASEWSVQAAAAAAAPLLHEGHGRQQRFASGREDTLTRSDLAGENRPELPFGLIAALARQRGAVRDEDQVGGGESDVESRPRADDMEGLCRVGLAVQERQDRAEDQRSAAVRRRRGQDLVAGAEVTHRLGGAAFQGDPSVARETAAGFGCHGMFWSERRDGDDVD